MRRSHETPPPAPDLLGTVSVWLLVVPDLHRDLDGDAMSKTERTALIAIMLELSERAMAHCQADNALRSAECGACCDIVEKHLPFGWFEQYEREQAALQKSTVSKSRKSMGSGNRVRKTPQRVDKK